MALSNTTATVAVTLEMGVDQPYEIVSLELDEGMSEITRARLEIASRDNLDLSGALTNKAILTLLRSGLEARRWTLQVGGIRFLTAKQDSLRYEVELYAPAWVLRFTENTRKFRKLSAQDIITKVLDEGAILNNWSLTRATPRRNYCVQYHETNLGFVERLLEFEGIYYTFDEDGVMRMADSSAASPEVPGQSQFELIESADALSHGAEGIHELRRGSAAASGRATVNDFDWKKPKTDLLQTKAAERDGYLEIYDYPAGYRNAADGAYLAQIRLEALRVSARYCAGRGTVCQFAPARLFGFGGRAGQAFADDYLLVHVRHLYDNPLYEERLSGVPDGVIYTNLFRAIPSSVPFRPPVKTARPAIGGYHTAMVRGPVGEEIHTDRMGRFRGQFHWDREATGTDADSRWMRMVQESASSMFLARVGWEVNVAYIDGDPDRPVGLARDINGVMTPAYGLPGRKNLMTIKTPTSPYNGGYNEIRLDDSLGAMTFDLRAERDLHNLVTNDRSEIIGNNETHHVVGVLQENIERDQQIQIGQNLTWRCGKSFQVEVGQNRTDSVGGSETVDIGAGETVMVKGNNREQVASVRLTIAGSIKPPNPLDLVKNAVKGALPVDPWDFKGSAMAAAKQVGQSALSGAKSGYSGGGGIGGALSGALGSSQASLQNMIPKMPTASGLASSLTGGLSDGVTAGKLIDMFCQGGIARSGKLGLTRMVGGAYITASVGSITSNANLGLFEAIGGAKVTVSAKGNIAQSVMGPLTTTVGGLIMRQCKGDMSYSSPNSTVNVGGLAELKTDEKLEIHSDGTVLLEAQGKLSLVVGGLELTLTPSAVTIKGDVKLKAAESVTVSGKPDNITK
jgi:type VI secretion system secreted protein VgrG